MELIIQKSVELDANAIIPVKMKRCVVKIDEKSENKKIERYWVSYGKVNEGFFDWAYCVGGLNIMVINIHKFDD